MSYYNPDNVTDKASTAEGIIEILSNAQEESATDVNVYASGGDVVRFEKDVELSVFENSDGSIGVVFAPGSWEDRE